MESQHPAPPLAAEAPSKLPRTRHIEVIDGLRGIAILLVMGLHLWEISWLSIGGPGWTLDFIPVSGFIGVELFFFLSAFCLYYPLLTASNHAWGHYWRRRVFKIVPSYLLCLCLMAGISGATWQDIAAHLLFVYSWWPETYGSINGVFWSLSIEVQFYCLFPLLVGLYRKHATLIAISTVALAIGYRGYWEYASGHAPGNFQVNQLPGFLDVFMAGILAADLSARLRRREWAQSIAAASLASVIGLLAIASFFSLLYGYYAVRYDISRDAWLVRFRPWLALNFLVMAVALQFSLPAVKQLFANRLLRFMALISYNLYLWHQVIARTLLAWRLPDYNGVDPHGDPVWQWQFSLIAALASIALTWLLTRFFEQPILRRAR